MDVAILVYKTSTVKLHCGTHQCTLTLHFVQWAFSSEWLCECTLWPFKGIDLGENSWFFCFVFNIVMY